MLLGLSTAAVAILVLPRAIHTDDLEVIGFAVDAGYGEIWSAPFRELYYRPLVVSIVKLGLDTIGANLLLRIVQALLIAGSLYVYALIARPMVGPARLAGGLCLLAAPFTFVSVAPFGVGIADSIVGLALLVCIRDSKQRDQERPWVLLAATLVALAAKESGLVVAAYAAAECLRRRQLAFVAAAVAITGLYIIAREAMVDSRLYVLRTGYLFEMYSVAEQRLQFGSDPLALRAYTAVANFTSVLTYLPFQGQLRLTPSIAAFAVGITTTAVVTGRYLIRTREYRQSWALLLLLPCNAALGFAYARPRIMFVAYVGIAVLLACAIDDMWRKRERVLAALVTLEWVAMLASTLSRLSRML